MNGYEESRLEYLVGEFYRYAPMTVNLSEYDTKRKWKNLIRDIADDNCDFENLVFELGCNKLAKELLKHNAKNLSH